MTATQNFSNPLSQVKGRPSALPSAPNPEHTPVFLPLAQPRLSPTHTPIPLSPSRRPLLPLHVAFQDALLPSPPGRPLPPLPLPVGLSPSPTTMPPRPLPSSTTVHLLLRPSSFCPRTSLPPTRPASSASPVDVSPSVVSSHSPGVR